MGKKPAPQKYGAPLYAVFWAGDYAYMCGGGNLGIENKIVVVSCKDGVLSDEVAKLNVGSDAPYRMALHPSGRSAVMGMTMGGLKRANIDPGKDGQPPVLTLAGAEFDAFGSRFSAVKSLGFSSDGRQLAVGGEDGWVEVLNWPAMGTVQRWQASEKAIRNLDFSAAHSDGVLATVDESGACKLWDVTSGELVTQLQPPADLPRATFFRCKAAVDEDGIALYTPMKFKGAGYVLRWRQDERGEIKLEARSPKPVTPAAPICGFEASHSGRLLAAVTPEGDQCVVSASTLKPVKYKKGAHMTFATAVAFAPDDSAILSTSADASAVLTEVGAGGGGFGGVGTLLSLLGVLFVLLAVVAGMLRRLAAQEPEQVAVLLAGLPEWAKALVRAVVSL